MTRFWKKHWEGALMFLMTFLLLCAGLLLQERVSRIMEADMEDKLLEITAQIRSTADQKLESNFAVLHAVAGYLEAGEPAAELMESQKARCGFSSLGVVGLDGEGVYGPDLAAEFLPVMTEAFRGNDRMLWMRRSPFGEENCVLVTVPLERKGMVVGAVYAVFSGGDMPGLSSPDVFGGHGMTMIVGDGFHQAASWRPAYERMIPDDTLSMHANAEAGERMKRKLYVSRRGVEKFHINGQETYVACVPLRSIPGWYALTAIPATVVLKKINAVILLMSVVVIALCCALVALAWVLECARRENRRQLYDLAYTDCLTGLNNWKAFTLAAEAGLEKGRDYALAVAGIRECQMAKRLLDGLQRSEILKRAAAVLSEILREDERLCRIEEDCFGLLLADGGGLEERMAEAMERLSREAAGLLMEWTAGIVHLGRPPVPLTKAMECCLMARESLAEGARVCVYRQEVGDVWDRRRALVSGVSGAAADGELLVYLQPVVDLRDGRLRGAEALARWQHPVYGFLTPEAFVPLLEEFGNADRLDLAMAKIVCGLLREWDGKGLPPLPVSLNLSGARMDGAELAEELWEIAVGAGVAPGRLALELRAAQDGEVPAETGRRLKEKGFLLAADGFATERCPVAALPDLPLDSVKLDRRLIKDACLPDLAALAGRLCKTVVAVGVEDGRQAQNCLEAGCGMGQGHYYARPMPPEGYERLLKNMGRGLPHA